jgi:arginase family enzyme
VIVHADTMRAMLEGIHLTPTTLSNAKASSLASRIVSLHAAGTNVNVDAGADASAARLRIALIGAPDDLGVGLNNGRPGAADGPGAVRAALARFGVPFDALMRTDMLDRIELCDAGDVTPVAVEPNASRATTEAALFETHDRVRAATRGLHDHAFITIGLGGGHDLTLPMVQGAFDARLGPDATHDVPTSAAGYVDAARFGGVNIDAHLDVREAVGSGMPFRQLIERGALAPERFTVLGAGRFASTPEHVRWLERDCGGTLGGARVVTIDEARGVAVGNLFPMRVEEALRRAHVLGDHHLPGFVTFDLDAIDASAAPGVSAINPSGLTTAEAAKAAELAGLSPGIVHFDVMELNPRFDLDGRTARLAANLILHFIAGCVQRKGVRRDDVNN